MTATAAMPSPAPERIAPAASTRTVLWANPRIADADHDGAAAAYSKWCGRTVSAEQVAGLDRAALGYLDQLDGAPDDPATLVHQFARVGCPREVAERLVWWQETATRILATVDREKES